MKQPTPLPLRIKLFPSYQSTSSRRNWVQKAVMLFVHWARRHMSAAMDTKVTHTAIPICKFMTAIYIVSVRTPDHPLQAGHPRTIPLFYFQQISCFCYFFAYAIFLLAASLVTFSRPVQTPCWLRHGGLYQSAWNLTWLVGYALTRLIAIDSKLCIVLDLDKVADRRNWWLCVVKGVPDKGKTVETAETAPDPLAKPPPPPNDCGRATGPPMSRRAMTDDRKALIKGGVSTDVWGFNIDFVYSFVVWWPTCEVPSRSGWFNQVMILLYFFVNKNNFFEQKMAFLLLYRCGCIRFDNLVEKEKKEVQTRNPPAKLPEWHLTGSKIMKYIKEAKVRQEEKQKKEGKYDKIKETSSFSGKKSRMKISKMWPAW